MRTAIVAVTLLALAGCASDSGGGTHTFDYTLFSSDGNMPVGAKVIYLYVNTTSNCSASGDYAHDFEGTVTTANQIAVSYSHNRTRYWSTIYIDLDATATLTVGDLVFHRAFSPDAPPIETSLQQIAGECVDQEPVATSFTADIIWEDLAEEVGFTWGTFFGSDQTF